MIKEEIEMNDVATTEPTKLQKLKHKYEVNKPLYLQRTGYVGIGLTAFSGVYTGLKLPKAIDKAKSEIKPKDGRFKRFWKYFRRIAPVVTPTLICAGATFYSFKQADDEKNHRLAVVSAAYASAVAETDVLKRKIEEVGGKKVAKAVEQAVKDEEVNKIEDPEIKEKLEEQRNTNPSSVNYTGGCLPYYDPMLKKIFWTTPDTFVRVQSKMLSRLRNDNEVDMSILYEELGYGNYCKEPLPMFACDYGWQVAYNDPNKIDYLESQLPNAFFDTDSTSVTKDGIPCKFIEYIGLKPLRIDMSILN